MFLSDPWSTQLPIHLQDELEALSAWTANNMAGLRRLYFSMPQRG
jgi:hypothetical protein